jgi:tricorn protease
MRGLASPDGTWIASAERDQELWLYHTKTAEKRRVAVSPKRNFDSPDLAWSPDGQWLAFANSAANDYSVIWLYCVASDRAVAITTERTDSGDPAWSPDGKWLYILSARSLQSTVSAPWGLRQPEPFFDRTVKIYQLALSADTRRSPFQPDDELCSAKKDAAPADKDAKPATPPPTAEIENQKSKIKNTKVDLDGLATRLWEVPVAAGNYSRLHVNDKALFVLDRSRGTAATPETGARLLGIEIKNKDIETSTVSDGVSSFELSADGKKILLRRTNDLHVIDAAARPATALDKSKVNLGALKFSFQPRESWRQMFTDAWRLHRDYFYDPGMHGVDWPANLAKHLPLVDRVTDRAELNDALTYMMSELSALHTAVQPGDVRLAPDEEIAPPASLGARLVHDEARGGWRIEHIYEGYPDYPDKLSPLPPPRPPRRGRRCHREHQRHRHPHRPRSRRPVAQPSRPPSPPPPLTRHRRRRLRRHRHAAEFRRRQRAPLYRLGAAVPAPRRLRRR